MKVWVDTNLFLDILLERGDFFVAASRVFALAENDLIEGCIAPITVNNIYYYISRKTKTMDIIKDYLSEVTRHFDVAVLDHDTVKIANRLKMRDYEDALQYAMAMQSGAEILVTRNIKDYTRKDAVEVLTPEAFIERITA